jgi:hypothetical protein
MTKVVWIVQERWAQYSAKAGVQPTPRQLWHTHLTEFVNGA